MADRIVKVRIVENLVAGLALHGSQAKSEALAELVRLTLSRLNIKRIRGVEPYTGGGDNHPPIHDVKRWLDSLTTGGDDKEQVAILKRIYRTLKDRKLL